MYEVSYLRSNGIKSGTLTSRKVVQMTLSHSKAAVYDHVLDQVIARNKFLDDVKRFDVLSRNSGQATAKAALYPAQEPSYCVTQLLHNSLPTSTAELNHSTTTAVRSPKSDTVPSLHELIAEGYQLVEYVE